MTDHLPSIAALRALEAAARHNNFTKAAEELHVTPSAISHQIRHLEEAWALKLFDRRPRQVALTRNGQALASLVRDFICGMQGTLESLRAEDGRQPLRVSMLTSFAYKWLVPRLSDFHARYPDIDVWISTNNKPIDFASEKFDAAIRLGYGDYPGLHTTFLLREQVFPVCSPEYLKRAGGLAEPADLLDHLLMHRIDSKISPTWGDWFHKAGIDNPVLPKGPHFPDTNMGLRAAINGQGIALARSALVNDDLARGALIKLFDVHFPSNLDYYLVCPEGKENSPRLAAFRGWLVGKAAASQKEFDRLAAADV